MIPEQAPWVRIVIVNYNAGALLQACIDALAIQTRRAFEAVIVDNASTNPPIADLKLPDQRFTIVHAGGNIGFAAASNLGARGDDLSLARHAEPRHTPAPGLAGRVAYRDRTLSLGTHVRLNPTEGGRSKARRWLW